MRTLVSGGELTRTGRLVESSIDSGVGKASAVPASCIFWKITCGYCSCGLMEEKVDVD